MEVRSGDYRIKTDVYQWMFQKFTGTSTDKRTGKVIENWDTWGYYPNPEQLIDATCQRLLRTYDGGQGDAVAFVRDTLTPLVEGVRGIQDELKERLNDES